MSQHEAGRELDALVAEKVMGWKLKPSHIGVNMWETGWLVEYPNDYDDLRGYNGVWAPSTFIAAAWEVVEKLTASGYEFSLDYEDDMWSAIFTKNGDGIWCSVTPDAPLAFCLAALAAVGEDV